MRSHSTRRPGRPQAKHSAASSPSLRSAAAASVALATLSAIQSTGSSVASGQNGYNNAPKINKQWRHVQSDKTFTALKNVYYILHKINRNQNSDCNPKIEFSILGFGIEKIVIPRSRFGTGQHFGINNWPILCIECCVSPYGRYVRTVRSDDHWQNTNYSTQHGVVLWRS